MWFITHVGTDNFNAWVAKIKDDSLTDSDCSYGKYANIKNFLRDFNIPREVVEDYIYNDPSSYFSDYDLDILYSGDDKAIDEYYSDSAARYKTYTKNDYLRFMKSSVYTYIDKNVPGGVQSWKDSMKTVGGERYSPYFAEFTGAPRQWSILEAVERFNIPREVLEDFQNEKGNSYRNMYSLDLGLLYSGKLVHTREDDPAALDELLLIYAETKPALPPNRLP